MCRWLVVLVLSVVSTTAWGQSVPATPAASTTSNAQQTVASVERRVAQLTAQRATLNQSYAAETQAIADLARERASWRRDRDLAAKKAEANETARQLEAISRDLATVLRQLATARGALAAAIDAELAAGATGSRAQQLAKWKGQLAPQRAVHRIVIPETKLDMLADPEELDEQAAALRETEQELQRQFNGLDSQVKDLDTVAKLRNASDRMGDLDRRDSDSTRHPQSPSASGKAGASGDAATAPLNTGSAVPEAARDSSFAADAPTVLVDVVDASTLESLKKGMSGTAEQRAEAIRKVRDAVAARALQLAKRRAEIETRSKTLRKH